MDNASDFAYIHDVRFGGSQPKANTNVIEINLSCLKQGSSLATGDPIHCLGCNSLLNCFSNLIRTGQNIKWNCEFCGAITDLSIEEEELPTESELTYVLESAAEVSQVSSTGPDSSVVIFCIDISGSMCVTKPVTGILNLKTNKQQELMKLIQHGEEEQFLPGANRNLTYVSRLECVQAAIESQLQTLSKISPRLKVGIVAFNNEVKVIGDGTHEVILAGDRLNDFESLQTFCQERSGRFVEKSIQNTVGVLTEKVIQLEENGSTALGPALLVSLLLASEGGAGSKVIICTDGLANTGLGSLEFGCETDFYSKVSTLATDKGVSVSVISIQGDECRLETLMKLTEISGGNIVRVAPENLSDEFSNILSEDVIATHVTVEVTIHKSVEFRDEDPISLSLYNSRLQKRVGNATNTSSFSFNYRVKTEEELRMLGIEAAALKNIPMQAVFTYMSLEGMKCIRVINKLQPVTFDVRKAKQNANVKMLARCGRREVAKYAEQGRFEDVRSAAQEWKNVLVEQEVKAEEDLRDIKEFDEDLYEMENELVEQECLEIEKSAGLMKKNQEKKEESKKPEEGQERRAMYADKFVNKLNQMKKKS